MSSNPQHAFKKTGVVVPSGKLNTRGRERKETGESLGFVGFQHSSTYNETPVSKYKVERDRARHSRVLFWPVNTNNWSHRKP